MNMLGSSKKESGWGWAIQGWEYADHPFPYSALLAKVLGTFLRSPCFKASVVFMGRERSFIFFGQCSNIALDVYGHWQERKKRLSPERRPESIRGLIQSPLESTEGSDSLNTTREAERRPLEYSCALVSYPHWLHVRGVGLFISSVLSLQGFFHM